MRFSFHLAALALLAASSAAQAPVPPLGPFSTAGVGFTEGNIAPNELMHRRPEPGSNPAPFQPATATGVTFTRDEIFAQLDPADRDKVVIDAISTGNDMVPIAPGGRLVPSLPPPQGRAAWSALFFSLTNGSTPLSGSPMAAMKSQGQGNVGGHVFSWVALGSSELLGVFANQVHLEVTAGTLGMTQQGELASTDIPMALLVQNGGDPDNFLIDVTTEVFFSLTAGSASDLRGLLGFSDASGATIFHTYWENGGWTPITVYRSAAELGLEGFSATNPDDDAELDALAVWAYPSFVPPQIIFSTEQVVASSTAAQLEVMWGFTLPAVPLLDAQGKSLRDRLGGPRTDVDAVCGIDPEKGQYSHLLGTPVSPGPRPFTLSASVVEPVEPRGGGFDFVVNFNAPNTGDSAAGIVTMQWRPIGTTTWLNSDLLPSRSWNCRGTLEVAFPWSSISNKNEFRAVFVTQPWTQPKISTKVQLGS